MPEHLVASIWIACAVPMPLFCNCLDPSLPGSDSVGQMGHRLDRSGEFVEHRMSQYNPEVMEIALPGALVPDLLVPVEAWAEQGRSV